MPYNNPSAYEPAPSLGESSGFASGLSAAGNAILDVIPSRTTTIIDKSKQTQLNQDAINQLIYQSLSGSGGVSAIKTAEAASGGYGSTSAALQSADLLANVAGQIGELTGPKVEQSQTTTKKKKSIICTKLYELGEISSELYFDGQKEFQKLPPEVIVGYHLWGYRVADLLDDHKVIRVISKFIALQRYKYVLNKSWNLTGWLTVVVGEPVCAFIGLLQRRKYARRH